MSYFKSRLRKGDKEYCGARAMRTICKELDYFFGVCVHYDSKTFTELTEIAMVANLLVEITIYSTRFRLSGQVV